MISHVAKARAAIEELSRFLMANSLKDINKNLDKLYMVLILSSLSSYFDHAYDQILAIDQITSMDSSH